MGQPIVISMSDILLLAGAIVTISAAVKVICGAIEQFRKPNKTQDSRIAELESRSVERSKNETSKTVVPMGH